MSERAVQTTFNVPRARLQTHPNEKITLDANLGRMSRFTYQQERKLVNYACKRIDMGVQFGKKQVLLYASQLIRLVRISKVERHEISSGVEF